MKKLNLFQIGRPRFLGVTPGEFCICELIATIYVGKISAIHMQDIMSLATPNLLLRELFSAQI